MIDRFDQLKTLVLNVMFNPLLLGLLLILFFVGRIFGKLTKNIRLWKILLLGYVALFLYAPVRDAGPFLGGIFIAGMLSNHVSTLFSVLSWAGNLRDAVWAFRYRSAYDDIRRREQGLEERERRLREAELRHSYKQQEQGQRARAGWQQEAGNFRQKPEDKTQGRSSGGRQSGSSQRRRQQERTKTSNSPPPQNDVRARHLETLGLKPGRVYSPEEIKKAYRRKVMKVHPDAGGSQVKFIAVIDAYEYFLRRTG